MHIKTLPLPPKSLLDVNKQYQIGAYRGEWKALQELLQTSSVFEKYTKIKNWVWYGVFGPDISACFAMINAGYVGKAFCYLANKAHEARIEWTSPLSKNMQITGVYSSLEAQSKNKKNSLCISGTDRTLNLKAKCSATITVNVSMQNQSALPVSVFSGGTTALGAPTAGATVKIAGLPVIGTIEAFGEKYSLKESYFGGFDWSGGIFPHRMRWIWAHCSSLDTQAQPIGLNLCCGVHDDASRALTENALWISGVPERLSGVDFEMIKSGSETLWKISSKDNKVNLTFLPRTKKEAVTDYVLVSSDLVHMYGFFSGKIEDLAGRTVQLENALGILEQHEANW